MKFTFWLELGFTTFLWLVILFVIVLLIFFVKEAFFNEQ